MIRFSANLGFLWTDRPLPAAIEAAGHAGFDAVECHMPYAHTAHEIGSALERAGLRMVSLNTRLGDRDGDFGLAAIAGREGEARELIDEAVEYAAAIDCPNVSVVAGKSGRTEAAEATYRENLAYAAQRAAALGRTILIEPLNTSVADDYHLVNIAAAVATVNAVGADNLKIMVDCFHSRMMDGDLGEVFQLAWPHLGHIQISAYPDRGEPVGGEIDFHTLLPRLAAEGWDAPFGAEYTPRTNIDDGLAWLEPWRSSRKDET